MNLKKINSMLVKQAEQIGPFYIPCKVLGSANKRYPENNKVINKDTLAQIIIGGQHLLAKKNIEFIPLIISLEEGLIEGMESTGTYTFNENESSMMVLSQPQSLPDFYSELNSLRLKKNIKAPLLIAYISNKKNRDEIIQTYGSLFDLHGALKVKSLKLEEDSYIPVLDSINIMAVQSISMCLDKRFFN